MAVATPKTKLVTGEELLEMGDVGPCELVEGEIVKMSPTNVEHAYLESKISRLLGEFVEENKLGWVLGGEIGIYTRRNPDSVRGADVVFLSSERVPERPRQGFLEIAPDLVVEIVSPTDRWSDLHDKIEEYFSIGVDRIWVVEPRRKAVRIYASPTDVEIVDEDAVVAGEGSLVGFTLSVAELFSG